MLRAALALVKEAEDDIFETSECDDCGKRLYGLDSAELEAVVSEHEKYVHKS